ncbi:hypothetical protein ACH5RR_035460 [Cinchona calisaya]|uniref:SBP-type domain-containing protein n=1 Tax=Cinchona calisaya TaxID=153742 RepID=A0ABD2Y2N9_9GENT
MNSFSEMEWTAKWDWDNLIAFNSKACESLKRLQSTDWGIEDEGEMDAVSFDLSGIGGSTGGSGSDFVHGSSVKSSKSASTDSSPKEGMKTSTFTFERFEGSPGAVMKEPVPPPGEDLSRMPSPLESSVVSVEPLIGLKLGKRTYFENNSVGSSIKSPCYSGVPVSSISATKKTKSSCPNATIPRCQVEGCNLDLSKAKDYHRKHRICDKHSKCPKVTVVGIERRFCQQCSRFHSLEEFDGKKRSCRRRLSDHNARRRKPRQETIQFNSAKLSSSFYDGRQQMNFSWNTGNATWENVCGSKFTLAKHLNLKPEKVKQPPFPRIELPCATTIHGQSSNDLLTSKGTAAYSFKQGFKESISSNLDAAPESRALSLLSTNSLGSSEPESVSFDHPLHANPSAFPQGLPLASSEYWQFEPQSSTHFLTFTGSSNIGGHFQEIQLFKPQYQNDVYPNAWF